MILRRKVCLGALLGGILFFMIVTHTIPKGAILPAYIAASIGSTERMAGAPTSRAPTTTSTTTTTTPSQVHTCSCPTCLADSGTSEWFDQHFDPKQQPYLISEENNVDPDSLKWWMHLQGSNHGTTLEEMIPKMFAVFSSPPADWTPRRDRCRSCAVVGNSGNLLGSKYGDDIDANTMVIRMNKAITQGYEADVGNRTTHHIMYPESAVDLSPGVHLVLLPFKLLDLQWLTSALSTGEVTSVHISECLHDCELIRYGVGSSRGRLECRDGLWLVVLEQRLLS